MTDERDDPNFQARPAMDAETKKRLIPQTKEPVAATAWGDLISYPEYRAEPAKK